MGLNLSPARGSKENLSIGEQGWNVSLLKPISWSPYRSTKKKGACWIQLAGHEGILISNGKGSVLKRYNEHEAQCLLELQSDVLKPFVPKYQGEKSLNGVHYLQMQDLLYDFDSPSVMDCKMGQRTYLESEITTEANSATVLRPDMYLKMVSVSPDAPTKQEHHQRGVSKLRYMQWRETISSTACFGFRIEAVRHSNGLTNRDFKQTCSWSELKTCFRDFVRYNKLISQTYLIRLKKLRRTLELSQFFAVHEFIGSSLLFVHDDSGAANLWMIDFGKTVRLENNKQLNHRSAWHIGNHEEGYLVGVDNLIRIFEEITQECN